MLRPFSNIIVNDNSVSSLIFNKASLLGLASSILIESRRNEFTDRATLQIVNQIPGLGLKISDTFKQGDPIAIEMGYYPNKETIFEGYISEIIPDQTATIICEDEAYLYKRTTIDKSILLRNTTTTELFNQIFTGEKRIFDAGIGDIKILKDASLFDILNLMRDKFSLYSYFRNGVLIVGGGLNENLGTEKLITADFQGNVPVGESSINFKEATADQTIVKGVSQQRSGEKIIVYATYGKGNEIVVSDTKPSGSITGNIDLGENDQIDKATLEDAVRRKLQSISFTGVNGNVVIYGEPRVQHGDNIKLIDNTRPEINDNYKCVGVITSLDVDGGYRQSLELGIKVSI